MSTRNEMRELVIDMDLVTQRILKLAEIATLEHLESLSRSQADGLMSLVKASAGEWSVDRLSA